MESFNLQDFLLEASLRKASGTEAAQEGFTVETEEGTGEDAGPPNHFPRHRISVQMAIPVP